MTWVAWVSIAAVLLAAAAVYLAVQNRRALVRQGVDLDGPAGGTQSAGPEGTDEDGATRVVAFVANPTKPGVPELRDAAVRACAARYLPEPLWFDTTEGDPGVGQARDAVAQGATVVIAVGGDGTVRAVAEGLVGTRVAMGLIPQGTGNLLARNLELPINDVDALLRIALTGTERPIDVGWLRVVRDETEVADDIARADPEAEAPEETPAEAHEPARDHIFLVIAGLGFDAAMVADTDEDLKARVGWIAYFVAGMKHLSERRMKLEIARDDEEWHAVRLRSLLLGNVGRLPGGITLLPEAEIDDGWLDVGAIDTRGGIAGWTQLFGEVAMQRFGISNDLPNKIGHIDHSRAREVRVRSRDPQRVQVDGDTIGEILEIRARIDRHALVVRVPESATT